MESPYAPHDGKETREMLEALGAESVEELFDIPDEIRFKGEIGVEPRSERDTVRYVEEKLERNVDVVELLGRGHYSHYVPSAVDHLADRSEFLSSYTQYQPEVTQGFLQALFEYQSIISELTGLEVANASMYDYATALGEAALLAARTQDGDKIHIPENLLTDRKNVLGNYLEGTDLELTEYRENDGNADLQHLEETVDEDSVMVYVESPDESGVLEENLERIAGIADGCFSCMGSDSVALSLLECPGDLGFDAVVGDASVLGLPDAYGMQLGLFAARKKHLRQIPGRLVGVSEDTSEKRSYTLTLQTREQHIRKERATSNICTNQAWLALRAAIHTSLLGPEGLTDLARGCVETPRKTARRINEIGEVTAPIHDRHHFREFKFEVEGYSSNELRDILARNGYVVHALDGGELQVCVPPRKKNEVDGFVETLQGVVA